MASAASNLGPTSRALVDRVTVAVGQALRQDPGLRRGHVPVDMVTTSGSGLDPDITPASAMFQAPRVAKERGISQDQLMALVQRDTQDRQFHFLGEPRVNVLELNLDLDAKYPLQKPASR